MCARTGKTVLFYVFFFLVKDDETSIAHNGCDLKKIQMLFKKVDYKNVREYYNELNVYVSSNFSC